LTDIYALKLGIGIAWVVFWAYWLSAALWAKKGARSRRLIPLNGLTALSVALLIRAFRGGSLAVHGVALGAIGAIIFASGLALACGLASGSGATGGCR
jgi:hypothetical protein